MMKLIILMRHGVIVIGYILFMIADNLSASEVVSFLVKMYSKRIKNRSMVVLTHEISSHFNFCLNYVNI